MATIVSDTIKSATAEETLEGGPSAVRTFLVEAVGGTPATRAVEALSTAGIPPLGEGHPGDNSVVAQKRSAKMISTTQAEVTVEYGRPSKGTGGEAGKCQIEVGASLTSLTTNYDRYGKLIIVKYGEKEQVADVQVQVPIATKRCTRLENQSPEPLQVYVGSVNSGSSGIFPGARRSWMCVSIEGRSDDGGKTFTVTYVFARAPRLFWKPSEDMSTWDAYLAYREPTTGRMPADIKEEELERFEIYPEMDFGALNIF